MSDENETMEGAIKEPKHDDTLEPLPKDDSVLIPRRFVERYLPLRPQTLARKASEGTGPRMTKVGGRLVCYTAGDLRAWLAAQQK